jgi:two-component system chemotaxis sensor kinase CheA
MELDLSLVLPAFIDESREALDELEEILLHLEHQNVDHEKLNTIFRIAHTIKGSAGMFGLDDIVNFTHVVEGVLDRLRDGDTHISPELIEMLLACGDHIGHLVDIVETKAPLDDSLINNGNELISQLSTFNGPAQNTSATKDMVPSLQTNTDTERINSGNANNDYWHISLQFSTDTLRNGMEPLSMLHYLETLGDIINIITLGDAIPHCSDMDPESFYLRFEITFNTLEDKQVIEDAFEFFSEGSHISILPPNSKITDYIALINSSNSVDDMRIGDILLSAGALTQSELNDAINTQKNLQLTSVEKPLGDIIVEQRMSSQPVIDAAIVKQTQFRSEKTREAASVRVDAAKLDQLINLVGELVIASAGTALNAQLTNDTTLIESISTLTDLVEEVRDSALYLRMVPIGATFTRFKRVVHDMSKELGKEIELVVTGADTELDKTVVEKISDPLMHLVRNSIDHGIESAETRQANGKSATGVVTLNAFHDSGSIIIEVNDDGAGLNRQQILNKAIENGLIEEDQQLEDDEIYNLIFEPGFSTANEVTNISGRGVGMDVVKRNITELRGAIELNSKPGLGTSFRVRLPLTLAIIDGFLIGVSADTFVIPLDMVVECIELKVINNQQESAKNYIDLRGEVLPLIDLRGLLTIAGELGKRQNIVVVQYGNSKAGIVVDQLMGEFQTVIKPLGAIFSNVRAVSGFTVLGNGDVSLILDIPGLIEKAITKQSHPASITA